MCWYHPITQQCIITRHIKMMHITSTSLLSLFNIPFIFWTFIDELWTTKQQPWYATTTSSSYWCLFSSLWWCSTPSTASSTASSQGNFNHLQHQHHKLILLDNLWFSLYQGHQGMNLPCLISTTQPFVSSCPDRTLSNTQRRLFSYVSSSLGLPLMVCTCGASLGSTEILMLMRESSPHSVSDETLC